MLLRMISINDFKNIELRVGKVGAAERVEGSEKLIKLSVDLGEEKRQIIAGIGKVYAPGDLVGKQIVIVANLEPRKLMGLESNGMILAAHDEEGNPVILTVAGNAKIGSEIK